MNSFHQDFNKNSTIDPGRGQVLITKPIRELKLESSVLLNLSYYYLRVVDGRILFGGGRNLDFAGEKTNLLQTTEFYRNHLVAKLKEIFPNLEFEPDYWWAGIMGFDSENQMIRINKLDKNVWNVFGCNGIGIALSSYVGNAAVSQIFR